MGDVNGKFLLVNAAERLALLSVTRKPKTQYSGEFSVWLMNICLINRDAYHLALISTSVLKSEDGRKIAEFNTGSLKEQPHREESYKGVSQYRRQHRQADADHEMTKPGGCGKF